MKLYRTRRGPVLENNGRRLLLAGGDAGWDALLCRDDLSTYLKSATGAAVSESLDAPPKDVLAPIVSQEVWAAGVTYFRSRDARMEESQKAGGATFYDKVYTADRPELFFKATPNRVANPGEQVRIRADSKWNVPEPELTLVIAPSGKIVGYTIGNDMSSRDIEGENPLYLPQAKVYDKSCALGPCILVSTTPPAKETAIKLEITRNKAVAFGGNTTVAQLKRTPDELAGWLYRDNVFPKGAFLLTGTGIVPGSDFTLHHGDVIRITIDGIGTLENTVA